MQLTLTSLYPAGEFSKLPGQDGQTWRFEMRAVESSKILNTF